MLGKRPTISFGFIGCGRWAQIAHLPHLLRSRDHIRLSALSGIHSLTEAKQLISSYGFLAYYSSWQEMLAKERLDAVVVTTPHAFHYQQVRDALSHGCHVLVDKPPALTVEQLQELIHLSDLNGKIVYVASQRRFWKEYEFAKNLIKDGTVGDLKAIQGFFGQELFQDFSDSWRADPELCGGGITVDSGFHLIDAILFLAQSSFPMSVIMLAINDNAARDTHCSISLSLDGGCVASLMIIRGLPKNSVQEEIKLIGERGALFIKREKRAGNSYMLLEHLNEIGDVVYHSDRQLSIGEKALPVSRFVNAVVTEEVDSAGLVSNFITTVAVIEAAYESWNSNQIIHINLYGKT